MVRGMLQHNSLKAPMYRQLEKGQRLSSENFTRWEPSAEEGLSIEASDNIYNDKQNKVKIPNLDL